MPVHRWRKSRRRSFSFDEVASVSLLLLFLSEQLENSLPFVLVRDYLVEPVTEMLDVLTFNKAFHGALEGPRPQ